MLPVFFHKENEVEQFWKGEHKKRGLEKGAELASFLLSYLRPFKSAYILLVNVTLFVPREHFKPMK
jgi:hypothetical protein